MLLSEIDENVIERLTINLSVSDLDAGFVSDIAAVVKDSPGKISLFIDLKNEEGRTLNLFSRGTKVRLSKELKVFLRERQRLEMLDFKLS